MGLKTTIWVCHIFLPKKIISLKATTTQFRRAFETLLFCDFERVSFRHHKIIIIIMTGNNNLLRESNTNTTHERRRRRSGGGVFDDDVNDDDDASKRVSQHRKATLAAAEKVRRFGRLLCARFFHRWGCFPSLSLSLKTMM